MVGIIKYGSGNIYSVFSALKFLGKEVVFIENLKMLDKVNYLILPGVGSFASSMENLEKIGLLEKIVYKLEDGVPFLGICLGLQLLFDWSEEGKIEGFGILKGKVVKFKNKNIKIPHMGWNKVKVLKDSLLFKDIMDNSYFYFAHSYYVKTQKKFIIGKTNYKVDFPSIIVKENIVGTQFHPEKSGEIGLLFLKNFLEGKWLQ
ncbi:MAG: imidazole glycerol phosphate synthase subunit HisH [Candidatus Omnitrophica bacterium]|nr:imidazole glycerol phosphate synthase subunit HisH [Candidatus Omnitrophota bacterium]MCM8802016.1 imidazole glycerol phosphate synthase subunit HisH [Candidatus Omnitrophota bacterium]